MTGASIGSAAPARPICSGRAAALFAGSSSPKLRRTRRCPRSDCPTPQTCCRQPSPGRCCRAYAGERTAPPARATDRGHRRSRPAADAELKGDHHRPCRYLGRPGQRAAAAGAAVRRRRATPGAHHNPSSAQARRPSAAMTSSLQPGEGVRVVYEQSVDVAAAANAFAPYDLPASLAGLSSRDGEDPGAVGDLRARPHHLDRLAAARPGRRPLRQQLQDRGDARTTDVGTFVPVGPVGIVDHAVSRTRRRFLARRHRDVRDAAAGSGRAAGAAMTSAATPTGTSSELAH